MAVEIDKAVATNRGTVSLDCPWCGTHLTAEFFATENPREAWLHTRCERAECARGILVLVPKRTNQLFDNFYTGSWTNTLDFGSPIVYPAARPCYEEQAVPEAIRRDFQEALRCHSAGFRFGAALVARRVLQAAARDKGGKGKNLAEEIDSLHVDVLNAPLKASAHEIRYVGNDAAHVEEVTEDEVADLIGFTEDVLDSLYVVPARVAARKAKRTSK